MTNVIDRQTVVLSVNLFTFTGAVPSQISVPLNLRFAADELRIKSIGYATRDGSNDVEDVIQIWCNRTNDGLIGSFTNTSNIQVQHDEHFRLSNTFQTGNFELQFQSTDLGAPASVNPQPLISAQAPQRTFGKVVLTLEFVKLAQ